MSTVIGCVVDASDESLDAKERQAQQTEQFRMRLAKVLRIVEGEQRAHREASMVIVLCGMKIGAPCVDLVAAMNVIIGSTSSSASSTALLSGMTKPHHIAKKVTDDIRSQFTDTEFHLLANYLTQHEDLRTEMSSAITRARWVIEILRGLFQMAVISSLISYGRTVSQKILGTSHPGITFFVFAAIVSTAHVLLGSYLQELSVPYLKATRLAKTAYDNWTLDVAKPQPRPVSEVVEHLRQLVAAHAHAHAHAKGGNACESESYAALSELASRCATTSSADDVGQDRVTAERTVDLLTAASSTFEDRKLVLFTGSRQCEVYEEVPLAWKLKEAGVVVEML